MSSIWGNKLKLSIFGESHGNAIGVVIDGLPCGFTIDFEKVKKDMKRRAPGINEFSTKRKEDDIPEILSGYFEDKTTGSPLCAIIKNNNARSKDYSKIKDIMRPSQVDYTAFARYKGFSDYRGSGHFSGRITAALVFAGSIAKQILSEKKIYTGAHISSVMDINDRLFEKADLNQKTFEELQNSEFPLLDNEKEIIMKEKINHFKNLNDSLGGTVECAVIGLPAGIGNPFFNSIESVLSHLMFSIPAVKGIEFGAGFDITKMSGSKANDAYYYDNGEIKTETNNNGGIIGGISNGMPIIFKLAIKPTPSIEIEQKTVNIKTGENTKLKIEGRHDPIIVPRSIPVVEACSALGILDFLL